VKDVQTVMSAPTALHILELALQGDASSISFLENTCSVYVCNASSDGSVVGCWDFIHTALNEIDRNLAEERRQYLLSTQHLSKDQRPPNPPASSVESHIYLLGVMCRRAARRSAEHDETLVTLCLHNAAAAGGARVSMGPERVAAMVSGNAGRREMVIMGRMATLAFDFHRPFSPSADALCGAVAANVVALGGGKAGGRGRRRHSPMGRFVEEWIGTAASIPTLPLLAVVRHLGEEAGRPHAPSGARGALRSYSARIVQRVLVPTLRFALAEDGGDMSENTVEHVDREAGIRQRHHDIVAASALQSLGRWCDATGMDIVELQQIATATTENSFSLSPCPCDVVDLLCDALYSQSGLVLDGVADLLESILKPQEEGRKDGRDDITAMNDIVDVDDDAMMMIAPTVNAPIQTDASAKGSHAEEAGAIIFSSANATVHDSQEQQRRKRERWDIVETLMSAIGLQRLRFSDRQSNGDTAVCQSLVRTAANITAAHHALLKGTQDLTPPPPMETRDIVGLLCQATGNFSLHVCATALEALSTLITSSHPNKNDASPDRILPILLQRAICPSSVLHEVGEHHDNVDVNPEEFDQFRECCLVDALSACYLQNSRFYLERCVAIVENVCRSHQTTPEAVGCTDATMAGGTHQRQRKQQHLELEAALFSISAVSLHVLRHMDIQGTKATSSSTHNEDGKSECRNHGSDFTKTTVHVVDATDGAAASASPEYYDAQMVKCTSALIRSQIFIADGPLLLVQTCRFVAKYAPWFSSTSSQDMLDSAAELAMVSFKTSAQYRHQYQQQYATHTIVPPHQSFMTTTTTTTTTPSSASSIALCNILSASPSHFTTSQALAALSSGWGVCYRKQDAASSQLYVTISRWDRMALCCGICRVISACPTPKAVADAVEMFSLPTLQAIERLRHVYCTEGSEHSHADDNDLRQVGDEIMVLSVMIRYFFQSQEKHSWVSIHLLKTAWPHLTQFAEKYGPFEPVADALREVLMQSLLLPIELSDVDRVAYFKELVIMALLILSCLAATVTIAPSPTTTTTSNTNLPIRPMLEFVVMFIRTVGGGIDPVLPSETAPMGEFRDMVTEVLQAILDLLAVERASPPSPPSEVFVPSSSDLLAVSPDAVPAVFAVFAACVDTCPVLFLQVLEAYSLDGKMKNLETLNAVASVSTNNMFVYWVQQALISLSLKNVNIMRNAVLFLKAMVNIIILQTFLPIILIHISWSHYPHA